MKVRVQNFVSIFLVGLLFPAIHSCEEDAKRKCCECLAAEGKSDAYVYPLTPGSPSWAELKTGEEMYKASLIPSDQLDEMCTEGILESWLTYPLMLNVFAWPTPQEGIDGVEDNFNGLKEFFTRSNASIVAFNRYKNLDLSAYDHSASAIVAQGRFAITVAILELTIAQEVVLRAMSHQERRQLLEEALRKRTAKENDPLYPTLANAFDVLIMGRIMMMEDFYTFKDIVNNDIEIRHFIESGEYVFITGGPDPALDLNTIIGAAQDFISR